MRPAQIILSIVAVFENKIIKHEVKSFPTPKEAYEYINKVLPEEFQWWKPEYFKEIYLKKFGEYEFCGYQTTINIKWETDCGEYAISDKEFREACESFVNSSRCPSDYRKVADDIVTNMHRHLQSEFWKFVKHFIHALAQGRYDDRNKTAHSQAGDIAEFMELNNI